MRISRDRLSIPRLLGLPAVVLTSMGAKSGQTRTMPVIGVPDGKDIVLVASNWGKTRNPAWYYNLRANPVAELEFGGQTSTYTAREIIEPDEYQRLWQRANEVYIGFENYRQRTGNRRIPIMVLSPKAEQP